MPEFLWYFPEKLIKFPNFTRHMSEKMAEFYMIIARKIFFPIFGGGTFFGGSGGHMSPSSPSSTPMLSMWILPSGPGLYKYLSIVTFSTYAICASLTAASVGVDRWADVLVGWSRDRTWRHRPPRAPTNREDRFSYTVSPKQLKLAAFRSMFLRQVYQM